MAATEEDQSSPFFGSFPRMGTIQSVGLSSADLLGLLILSLAVFVFWDGPVWQHLRDSHLARIVVSYTVIPVAALALLWLRATLSWSTLFIATLVVGTVKLFLTAAIVVALGVWGR